MADLDTVAEVVVEARAVGVQQTTAATERLGRAVDGLASANDDLARSEGGVATATDRQTRYRISAAAAADRLQRQLDGEYRASKQMEAALRDLERARQQGIISASRQMELIKLAETRYAPAAAGADRLAAANSNVARSGEIAGHHLTNLTYQLSDVAASLGSGASPFTVLLQQGGQIAPILGETGVMGAVRGVGSAIARFITPAVGIVGGLTAAVVLGYGAWSRYDDDTRRVGATLEGLGRGLGLTTERFEALARSSAAASGVTVRQATDLATAFAAAGKFDPGNIARLIGVAKDSAATFGLSLDEAKTKLAEAFASPEGIDSLNRQLAFLDARTQATINSLFRQGKAQEAIALAIGKLPSALADAERAQSGVASAWERIKNAASDADQAAGRFLDRLLKGPSPQQRLDQIKQQLDAARQAEAENLVQPGSVSRTYTPPTAPTVASTSVVTPEKVQTAKDYESALRAGLERQAEMMRKEEESARNKALEKSLNEKSQKLKELQEEVGATSDEFKKYKDWQLAADEALKSGNPELMRRVDNVRDLKEASGILEQVTTSLTNAEGERMTAAEKASRQNAVEIAGIRASTVEGRARVAAQRQEEQQRGQLITRQQAQMQVEHAAAVVREQANQQLRDTLRDQELEAEEIRKRTALLSQDAETRAVTIARQREEQTLVRQGVDLQSELAQKVLAGAEANARLGVAYDRAADAQQRMRDGTRQIGQDLTSFLDDALLGTGKLSDAFKSLAKSFSSNTLSALLTGSGPLAGLFGTVAAERGQLGGLLGGQFSMGNLFSDKAISESLFGGAESGISKALAESLKPQQAGGGFASSKLGSGLMAAGAGASVGYSSQSPILGAASGALAGLMTGNPIMAAVGPVVGFGGRIGKRTAVSPSKPDTTTEKPADDRDQRPLAA